jgi:HD-like signal output (HDOD) protein
MSTEIAVPTLPVAQARALTLLREPDPPIPLLCDVVETDPALTAAVMRLANSAVSSPLTRVRTAREAIVRVGVTEARRVTLGVALAGAFRGIDGSQIDEDEMWRHLIASAVLADAAAWGTIYQAEAFTAGLLHDLGRLAMAAQDPLRYAGVVRRARRGEDPVSGERAVFGLSHLEWGEAVSRRWGMPIEITDAVSDHHGGERNGLSWAVRQARDLAASLGIGDGLLPASPRPPDPETPVIRDLGGPEAVLRRVEWYRGALRAA